MGSSRKRPRSSWPSTAKRASVELLALRSGGHAHAAGDAAGLVVLRQEHVQILLAIEDALQRIADVAARIVTRLLARRDDRRRVRRTPSARVVAAKEPGFSIQNPGPEIALHFVVGQFHQWVFEKTR